MDCRASVVSKLNNYKKSVFTAMSALGVTGDGVLLVAIQSPDPFSRRRC
jgi:hypothetical protein